jgi:hypothetical protein
MVLYGATLPTVEEESVIVHTTGSAASRVLETIGSAAAGTENSDPTVTERFLTADIADSTDVDQSTSSNDTANGEDTPAGREWYGDSAYGTGDLRGAIDDAGHEAVIKPKPLQSAVVGGFTVDDFIVDEDNQTVTCPSGNTRPISATRVATFGALCLTISQHAHGDSQPAARPHRRRARKAHPRPVVHQYSRTNVKRPHAERRSTR